MLMCYWKSMWANISSVAHGDRELARLSIMDSSGVPIVRPKKYSFNDTMTSNLFDLAISEVMNVLLKAYFFRNTIILVLSHLFSVWMDITRCTEKWVKQDNVIVP